MAYNFKYLVAHSDLKELKFNLDSLSTLISFILIHTLAFEDKSNIRNHDRLIFLSSNSNASNWQIPQSFLKLLIFIEKNHEFMKILTNQQFIHLVETVTHLLSFRRNKKQVLF